MKKSIFAYAIAALSIALVAAASIWEGSAVAAGPGELPDSGYYIATNSFPKNTVVDMKNLENEKTVRVIVAGTLDSPGLLASVSPEAVSALGLDKKSVTRVRVSMPVDTVAFARYTEGLAGSSDPDRNPRLAVENAATAPVPLPLPPAPAVAAASPTAGEGDGTAESATVPAEQIPSAEENAAETVAQAESAAEPAAAEEPVASVAANSETPPVEIPEDYVPPEAEVLPAEDAAEAALVPAEVPAEFEATAAVVATPETEEAASAEVETPAEAPEVTEAQAAEPEPLAEALLAEPVAEPKTEAPIAEAPVDEAAPIVADKPVVAEAATPLTPPAEGETVLELVPSEERPPVAAAVEPVGPVVAPIVAPVAEATPPAAAAESSLDGSLFVEPVPVVVGPPAAQAPAAQASVAAAPARPAAPASFTVPVVESLSAGKFYVQVGAFGAPEAAQAALKKIGASFPAVVQIGGGSTGYRVLVGPLNQGESGALALRLKRGGFPGAFVKKGS